MRSVVVGLVLVLALVPVTVRGQDASTADTDLQQRRQQRRIVVQPRPSPDVVQRDVDRAVEDLAAERRRDDAVRDATSPASPRPDLSEPARGGIQTRELNKALRR
jgi:hypothetical protein